MKTGQRLASIDLLRGVAALAVVFGHAITYADLSWTPSGWFHLIQALGGWGHLGVPLFFVISGFCIHAQCSKDSPAGGMAIPNFLQFWKRRFFRLYPAYLLALSFSMSFVTIAFLMGKKFALLDAYPTLSWRWLGIDYVTHATMLHGFVPFLDKAGGNPPLWTIAREEYLYLLYFPLLALRNRFGISFSVAVSLGVGMLFKAWGVFYLPPGNPFHAVVESSALALWFQWSLGALAAENHFGKVVLPRICSSYLVGAALFGFSAWLSSVGSFFDDYTWGLCFFILVNATVRAEKVAPSFRANTAVRLFAFFGLRSYSIYLVHSPIKSVTRFCLGSLGASKNEFVYLMCASLIVVLGVIGGCILFQLIEKRSLSKPRNDALQANSKDGEHAQVRLAG